MTGRSGGISRINLGLRYDIHPGWYEQTDRLAMFHVPSGKIAGCGWRSRQESRRSSRRGTSTSFRPAASACRHERIVRTDRNNLSPRLGVAYRPFGGSSTVIRGGYGLYFDMMPIDVTASAVTIRVPGNDLHESVGRPPSSFRSCFRRRARPGRRRSRCRARSIRISSFRTPTSGTPRSSTSGGEPVSASRTSRLSDREMWYTRDINSPEPDGRLYVEKPRPFPRYPDIPYVDNGATHDYHARDHRSRAAVLHAVCSSSWHIQGPRSRHRLGPTD